MTSTVSTPPRTAQAPAPDPTPAEAFDEVFVHGTAASDGVRGDGTARLPELPEGWHHAPAVARIARQPLERRHTILAGLFAIAAAVWAPLGIVAFLSRETTLFLLASSAVLVVVAAPRPRTGAAAADGARDLADRLAVMARQLAATARHVYDEVRERSGPAAARARESALAFAVRSRDAARRGAAVTRRWLRDAGAWLASPREPHSTR